MSRELEAKAARLIIASLRTQGVGASVAEKSGHLAARTLMKSGILRNPTEEEKSADKFNESMNTAYANGTVSHKPEVPEEAEESK